ncbi:MAG TPA: membrane protease subunit, partial [Pseudonocardia sp.]|nr:membrane protease subunit [Pseudonocardia sp.]
VHIDRVEIKDVALPETMKRSMSRQAEAERERRSRVITAEGELQASQKLAQAAEVMAEHPAALQLRLLQTVVEVAAEKNSTLVLPFPVELLRFLERSTPSEAAEASQATTPKVPELTEPTSPELSSAPEPATAAFSTPQAVPSSTPEPVNSSTPETVNSSEPEAAPSPNPATVAASRPAAVASSN